METRIHPQGRRHYSEFNLQIALGYSAQQDIEQACRMANTETRPSPEGSDRCRLSELASLDGFAAVIAGRLSPLLGDTTTLPDRKDEAIDRSAKFASSDGANSGEFGLRQR